jgi:hypothetical protein
LRLSRESEALVSAGFGRRRFLRSRFSRLAEGLPDEPTTLRKCPTIVLRFYCQYCERSVDMLLPDAIFRFGRRRILGELL